LVIGTVIPVGHITKISEFHSILSVPGAVSPIIFKRNSQS
jgi:hypothetical protein